MRSYFYLWPVSAADLLVRSAYQMGKTPLLPLFAASLGAGDLFVGLIVSVSTLTGMLLKPLMGWLSDRWGRRSWLVVGTLLFSTIPFLYQFVQTPEQLLYLRLFHGLSTAIYGPVTLAYVAEQAGAHRAEHLAWFGLARKLGYIIGPAAAGWMLLTMRPEDVFMVIGWISSLAFLPLLFLASPPLPSYTQIKTTNRAQTGGLWKHLHSVGATPEVWMVGGLEALSYTALYALKAFLPLYAASLGWNVALVGLFFSLQEGVHALLAPWGGRLGDRYGHRRAILVGMCLLGMLFLGLSWMDDATLCLLWAVCFGGAQALIFPALLAFVSLQLPATSLATGLGVVGSLRNAGKVIGPTFAGLLITSLHYHMTFQIIGGLLLLAAGLSKVLPAFVLHPPQTASAENERQPIATKE